MLVSRTASAVLAAGWLALALAPGRGAGQQPDDRMAHRLRATRPELEARLDQLRQRARASSATARLRAEMSYIETRLTAGDFHAGDRVVLVVEDPLPLAATPDHPTAVTRSQEQQLTDTFTVEAAQALLLPMVGTLSLRGLLRSELEPFLSRELGRYIHDPVLHARSLVSVGVTGEVARPGFYGVPTDAVLWALLTAAGGPTKDAKLNKLKLERNGTAVWKGDALRGALAQGRTLDELQVQSGDELVVPRSGSLSLFRPLQFAALLATLTVAAYAIASHF